MHEALCRSSGTTLDSGHAEDGPPITQRTSGLGTVLQIDDDRPPEEKSVGCPCPEGSRWQSTARSARLLIPADVFSEQRRPFLVSTVHVRSVGQSQSRPQRWWRAHRPAC